MRSFFVWRGYAGGSRVLSTTDIEGGACGGGDMDTLTRAGEMGAHCPLSARRKGLN